MDTICNMAATIYISLTSFYMRKLSNQNKSIIIRCRTKVRPSVIKQLSKLIQSNYAISSVSCPMNITARPHLDCSLILDSIKCVSYVYIIFPFEIIRFVHESRHFIIPADAPIRNFIASPAINQPVT